MNLKTICFLVILPLLHLSVKADFRGNSNNYDTLPGSQLAGIETSSATGNPLSIGDKVPDFAFSAPNARIVNRRLSTYKGKLIILDLWNIWCVSCIKAMPEMEALQKTFSNEIAILLVTANTLAQVNKLRSQSQIVKNVGLPVITDDTIVSKYFQPASFPMHVWLDSTGVVLQITNGYNTTVASVKAWLAGKKVAMSVKKERKDFDLHAPLWREGNGRQIEHLKSYSLMTSRIDYMILRGMTKQDSASGKTTWLHQINYPIYNLYEIAFCVRYNIPLFQFGRRCQIRSEHMDKIKMPDDLTELDAWAMENTWCYEIQVPPEKAGQIYEYMRQDLDRYFNLKSRVLFKKVSCLVLKRIPGEDKIKSKGIMRRPASATDADIFINHRPINTLSVALQSLKPDDIVVDETGYKGKIDIFIPSNKQNPPELTKALKDYGIALVRGNRVVPFLEITDH